MCVEKSTGRQSNLAKGRRRAEHSKAGRRRAERRTQHAERRVFRAGASTQESGAFAQGYGGQVAWSTVRDDPSSLSATTRQAKRSSLRGVTPNGKTKTGHSGQRPGVQSPLLYKCHWIPDHHALLSPPSRSSVSYTHLTLPTIYSV